MTLMNDGDILWRSSTLTDDALISPFSVDHLQPCSYDVTLDKGVIGFKSHFGGMVNSLIPEHNDDSTYEKEFIEEEKGYILQPHEFVLGSTVENVNLPSNIAARFEGKSSLGRIGLMTHITAGFIDPGFHGQITLEIFNVNTRQLVLCRGMLIGQLCFL